MCVLFYDREPRYEGKLLSEWLKIYAAATDNVHREVAADAIRHMGTDAIPYLMEDVRSDVPRWMVSVSPMVNRMPKRVRTWWRGFMQRQDRTSEGALGLTILGPICHAAVIPELVAGLSGGQVDSGPARALQAIGRPAVPYLIAILTNGTSTIAHRRGALWQIHFLGKDASDATGALIDCATNEPELLEQVVWALGVTTTNAQLVLPIFTKALQSPSAKVRLAAVNCIPSLRDDAKETIPALKACLEDKDPEVRKYADNSLRFMAFILGNDAEAYGLSDFKPPKYDR